MTEGHGGPPDQGTVRPRTQGDLPTALIGLIAFGLPTGIGAGWSPCSTSLDEQAT